MAQIDFIKSQLGAALIQMFQGDKSETKIMTEPEVSHWYSLLKDPKRANEVSEE